MMHPPETFNLLRIIPYLEKLGYRDRLLSHSMYSIRIKSLKLYMKKKSLYNLVGMM
jgi:hypothetical protein